MAQLVLSRTLPIDHAHRASGFIVFHPVPLGPKHQSPLGKVIVAAVLSLNISSRCVLLFSCDVFPELLDRHLLPGELRVKEVKFVVNTLVQSVDRLLVVVGSDCTHLGHQFIVSHRVVCFDPWLTTLR